MIRRFFSHAALSLITVSVTHSGFAETTSATASGVLASSYNPMQNLLSTPSGKTAPHAKDVSKSAALQEKIHTGYKHHWRQNVVGTIFWVGEEPTQNNPTPNHASSWDTQWEVNFGGYDDPDLSARAAGYRPSKFVPKQNPFYIALPYNDVINHKTTKHSASVMIPWFHKEFKKHGKSVCHNRWIAIHYQGRVCYAQWSDCGPFQTDDVAYVFGGAKPNNTQNKGAGIDLAPAVRDYLGFVSGNTCDWIFVDESQVPDGPWKAYGSNNPFSKDWVKDPEPIYAGAYKPKATTYASNTRRVNGSGKVKPKSGMPGITMKKKN